ncbi:MAG: hypothetical protein H6765_07280 [Candidatus Peribacteria bacterium]|nr:MAG: hypothetical protein H6765_07280 [Candidatus Peribacteria bacterium]
MLSKKVEVKVREMILSLPEVQRRIAIAQQEYAAFMQEAQVFLGSKLDRYDAE